MIYFNSQEQQCRAPFGAVVVNTDIFFNIYFSQRETYPSVNLVLYSNKYSKTVEMKMEEVGRFSCQVKMPKEPQTLWYHFEIDDQGERYYYGNNLDRLGGEGHIYSYCPYPYQITVFLEEFDVPAWFRKSVMYQIFPDRFCNGNADNEILNKDPEYKLYDNWTDEMDLSYSYDGRIRNDFYGGNIKGVLSKIEYLKKLGISVIYFNPIFQAYSNHRYDTGDFKKIDPIFGTNQEFKAMVKELHRHGIKVILDGVFNHTGEDSIYFNKFGKYDSIGACQGEKSPYYNWFTFYDFPTEYECWWGIKNVPSVNEMTPSYLDYIIRDEDSVIATWLKAGIDGWRLDVADELPSQFLEMLRNRVKQENEDAIIIGEVWEDASNKQAYGEIREYFGGKQLDSVMNYPFYDVMVAFVNKHIDGKTAAARLMSIQENYPKQALYATMNMLGTHDRARFLTLAGENAINKLKLAVACQMTYVGVPSIYYGDEIGMEGGADPLNRAAMKWHDINQDLLETVTRLVSIRNQYEVLSSGFFKVLYADKNVFGFLRYNCDGKDAFGEKAKNQAIVVLLNNSDTEWAHVTMPKEVIEQETKCLFKGAKAKYGLAFVEEDRLSVSPMGAAVLECSLEKR